MMDVECDSTWNEMGLYIVVIFYRSCSAQNIYSCKKKASHFITKSH